MERKNIIKQILRESRAKFHIPRVLQTQNAFFPLVLVNAFFLLKIQIKYKFAPNAPSELSIKSAIRKISSVKHDDLVCDQKSNLIGIFLQLAILLMSAKELA